MIKSDDMRVWQLTLTRFNGEIVHREVPAISLVVALVTASKIALVNDINTIRSVSLVVKDGKQS